VEQTKPLVKGKSRKYMNADLPAGCQEQNIWRGKLILTYIQYMSTHKSIWGLDDEVTTATLQAIWNFFYSTKIECKILSVGPIFSVVSFVFISRL